MENEIVSPHIVQPITRVIHDVISLSEYLCMKEIPLPSRDQRIISIERRSRQKESWVEFAIIYSVASEDYRHGNLKTIWQKAFSEAVRIGTYQALSSIF